LSESRESDVGGKRKRVSWNGNRSGKRGEEEEVTNEDKEDFNFVPASEIGKRKKTKKSNSLHSSRSSNSRSTGVMKITDRGYGSLFSLNWSRVLQDIRPFILRDLSAHGNPTLPFSLCDGAFLVLCRENRLMNVTELAEMCIGEKFNCHLQ